MAGEIAAARTRALAQLHRLRSAERPLSVATVAKILGLPGPWTLRRMEERKLVPPARRTPVSQERYWLPDDIPPLRAAIEKALAAEEVFS